MSLDFSAPKQLYRELFGVDMPNDVEMIIAKICLHFKVKPDNMEVTHFIINGWLKDKMDIIPAKINHASKVALAEFKAATDSQASASMAKAKADLAAAVGEAAHTVAKKVAGATMFKWGCGCFVIALLCLGGTWWKGHKDGLNAGIVEGYNLAKDQVAAAAWANTPQGRKAYKMAVSGALEKVIRCDSPGWGIKDGACYVQPAKDGSIYGWLVP